MPTEEINDDFRIQLVVFERKAPHLPWEYTAAYKADTREQCDASELTIRRTFLVLHRNDGVEWAVVVMGDKQAVRQAFEKPPYKTLARIPGKIAFRFPELDVTPRCICGRMLAVLSDRAICTCCGTQPLPAAAEVEYA
ncbi:MAG: hypothetical protein KF828_06845 [Anaerolineales bacterium]|nr:hypothetical protein [Anaerolineales bacterium]